MGMYASAYHTLAIHHHCILFLLGMSVKCLWMRVFSTDVVKKLCRVGMSLGGLSQGILQAHVYCQHIYVLLSIPCLQQVKIKRFIMKSHGLFGLRNPTFYMRCYVSMTLLCDRFHCSWKCMPFSPPGMGMKDISRVFSLSVVEDVFRC